MRARGALGRWCLISNSNEAKSANLRVEILETNQGMTESSVVVLSDDIMEKMGLFTGDLVEISGGRTTIAYCQPERLLSMFGPATRSPSLEAPEQTASIKMNAVTRSNAEVKLGDKVSIQKTYAMVAGKVSLLPLYQSPSLTNVDAEYFKKRSSNSVGVMLGDNIIAGAHAGRQVLQVVDLEPLDGTADLKISNISNLFEILRGKTDEEGTKGDNTRNETQEKVESQSQTTTPFVIYPRKTEFEILQYVAPTIRGAAAEHQLPQGVLRKPIRGFPAFWVDVGLGGRTDPMLNKYLSLTLSVSHPEGAVGATFEVQKSSSQTPQEPETAPFDFGNFLKGLTDAAAGKPGTIPKETLNPIAAMHRIMNPMGDIVSSSAPFIEAAAEIMEKANQESIDAPGSVSPSDLKYRILKKWAEM